MSRSFREGVDARDRLSHGDTLMCKIWNDSVKGEKSCGPIKKPYIHVDPINFKLISKANLVSGS